MSKRCFLTLKDDNFWGNTVEKKSNEVSTSEENERENVKTGEDLEEGGGDTEDGWEGVARTEKRRVDIKEERPSPFGATSGCGGFGRTNLSSLNDSRHAFYQAKTVDTIKNKRGGASLHSDSWNSTVSEDKKHFKQIKHDDVISEYGVYNETDKENGDSSGRNSDDWKETRKGEVQQDVCEDPLLCPNVEPGKPSELYALDPQYTGYYEYLCVALSKFHNSKLPLNVDCEANRIGRHGVCRALQPKYYHHHNVGNEIYSKKVFVGGLPVDMDEMQLVKTFSCFGDVNVDWPHKSDAKKDRRGRHRNVAGNGYVFLIFDHELSVRALLEHCLQEDDKLFLVLSSGLTPLKVQIRPWRLADSSYLVDVQVPINFRTVIFVGGVPRPIRSVELAHIFDRLYGSVASAGIDTDVEYKYPKGAGRVAFTSYNSYMRAIQDRFVVLKHGDIEKRVEMKPYILDEQQCDECLGAKTGGAFAPFFCPHLECLQYYCETCWTLLHSKPTREKHRPLVKEA